MRRLQITEPAPMFALGDIVARVGSGRRVMVVDTMGPLVVVAWLLVNGSVRERVVHASALVLIRRAKA